MDGRRTDTRGTGVRARTPPRSQGVKKERKKTRIKGRDVAGRASHSKIPERKERKQTRQTRDGTRTGSPPARAGFWLACSNSWQKFFFVGRDFSLTYGRECVA